MLILMFVTLLLDQRAFAHAGFAVDGVLKPRNASTSLKTAPCGNVARTSIPTELTAGSIITVNWRETINHPGHFELQFSEDDDQTWTLLKSIPDDQDGGNLPHLFSTRLTVPNRPCTGCTIRLIQSMEENPAAPSLYYSCADVTIRAATSTSNPTPPSPAPTCP